MSLDWSAKNAPRWDEAESDKRDSIIWGTMHVGINRITAENSTEFYKRYVKFYRVRGMDPYASKSDVEKCVGLHTNASSMTPAAFNKWLLKILEQYAANEAGEAE